VNRSVMPRKAAFAFIFVTVLLDMLALGMVIPVLPKLIESFLAGDTARASEFVGLFSSVWALMQFLFSPVQGALSDRFGRRPVILVSNFGLGLDYVVMALAPNLMWLFAGRVISGICAASISTAFAYIADVTPPEQRSARFGMIGAAFGVGFVIGPAVGGMLGALDPRLPFWAAAGFSLLNGLYGLTVLPESLAPDKRMPLAWRRANPAGSLMLLRTHHELFGLARRTSWRRSRTWRCRLCSCSMPAIATAGASARSASRSRWSGCARWSSRPGWWHAASSASASAARW